MLRLAVHSWLRVLGALAAGAAVAVTVALAADNSTSTSTDSQDNSGVFVGDSAIALERLALAQRMERLKEWGKSADLYQEILTKFPTGVVAVPSADGERVVQYTSVTDAVSRALCKWPPEGLEVYRSHYETPAANMLAKAGTRGEAADLELLHRVQANYFPTDSGKTAGIRLMDAYFESGDYAAVAQIGRRLLDWHPNLITERPMTLYRTALAEKLCGEMAKAQRHAQELRLKFPQAIGSLRGSDTALADSLDQELVSGGGAVVAPSDSWLTVGGDETRNKSCVSSIKPGARLYSLALSPLPPKPAANQNPGQPEPSVSDADRQSGAALGVMPVADRGELYFQDNARLYAVSLDTGRPLAGWDQTWHAQNGCYVLPGGADPLPPGQQFCVSLSDKALVAVMGLPNGTAGMPPVTPPQTRLVCLDRKTGSELWTASVAQLPDIKLRELQIGGAPLIVGDNVYIIAHGGQGAQFEECRVLCFGMADGQFRWATYIASTNNTSNYFPNAGLPAPPTVPSHLAYASGRVFVLSNLGAVAALDAFNGTVAWLDIYRDRSSAVTQGLFPPGAMGGGMAEESIPVAPWTYNPAIVCNGKVFVLPSDSPHIFVYDADTGAELNRILLEDLPPGDGDANKPDTILSVDGEMMYLAGSSRVWRLPWEKYDHDNDRQPAGYWASVSTGSDARQVRGRAFVTSDALYLPMASTMQRILLKNGMIDPKDGSFPRNGWEEGQEGPGNVLVAGDYVIVAGDQHVAVYTDLDVARQKLDSEIATAPNEPLPRLHYAEVMFAAGQNATAEDKFQEVFQLLGTDQNPGGRALRDRAFDDALNFAVRLSRNPAQNTSANRMFDMSKSAARSPAQQVSYRMARAKFDLAQNDLATALELYQEILADDALRQVPVPDPETSAASHAGKAAEKSIRDVLAMSGGPRAYDKFEQVAAAALSTAKSAEDTTRLIAVAEMYPNAPEARQALFAAADVFEAGDNPRQATLMLRQLLGKSHEPERTLVLEAMARNYLKMPARIDVAATRLAQAASASPDATLSRPLALPDGTVLRDMKLSEARDRLQKFVAQEVADALPDLHLPTAEQCKANPHLEVKPFLPEPPDSVIKNVDDLVVPMAGFARNDRIMAWSAMGGLAVYPIGKNKPSFTCPQISDPPAQAAWMEAALVIWTNTTVFLLDPDSGKVRVQADLASLPELDVMANPALTARARAAVVERPEQITEAVPVGDRVVFSTTAGRIFSMDTADGHIVWQNRVGAHSITTLLASDDFTVIVYDEAQIVQLIVLNSFNGDLVGRKSFSRDAGIYPLKLALGDDGTLVYTLPDQLCMQDLYEANRDEDGMKPKFTTPATPELFVGASGPDRMIVHGDRAFVLTLQGRNVQIYSLENGQPWPQAPVLPSKADGSPDVELYLSGRYLYLLSPRHMSAYGLDDPANSWDSAPAERRENFEQILFGKDYLMVVKRREPRPAENMPRGLTLCGYSRAPVPSRPDAESGVFRYEFPIDPDSSERQPVEGGIVYFSGNAIHTLLGARESIGAGATTP